MICIFFIGLYVSSVSVLCEQGSHEEFPNNEMNSDNDELNEALRLVDKIKSEYVKLLRERTRGLETTTMVNDPGPTCPTTTAGDVGVGVNHTFSSTQNDNNEPFFSTGPRTRIKYQDRVRASPIKETSTSFVYPFWHPAMRPVQGNFELKRPYMDISFHDVDRPSRRLIPLYPRRLLKPRMPQTINMPSRMIYATSTSSAAAARSVMAHSTLNVGTAVTAGATFAGTKSVTTTTVRSTITKKASSSAHTNPRSTTTANSRTSSLKSIKYQAQLEVASALLKEFKQMNITLSPTARKQVKRAATTPGPGALQPINDSSAESDDDKLNQALLLVEMLKSEYIKLLRRNTEANENGAVGPSSCATSGDCSSIIASSSGLGDVALAEATKVDSQVTASPAQPAFYTQFSHDPSPVDLDTSDPRRMPQPEGAGPGQGFRRVNDAMFPVLRSRSHTFSYLRPAYLRRNIPDYYYYYESFRRTGDYYDDDDNIKETQKQKIVTGRKQGNETRSLSKVPARSKRPTSDIRRRQPAKQHQNKIRKIRPHESRRNVAANSPVTTAVSTSKIKYNTSKPAVSIASGASSALDYTTTTYEPPNITTTAPSSITKFRSKFDSEPSTTPTTEKWPAFSFKPTLRIFLENSTPLPIPFPKNNAFCFTNPTSALCRSP